MDIAILKDLHNLLQSLRLDFSFSSRNQVTALERLNEGIKTGKYSTDDEAAYDLYSTDAGFPSYRMLKLALLRQLSNKFLTSNATSKALTTNQKSFFNIQKNLAAAKVFMSLGGRKVAIPLLELTFEAAAKNELNFTCVEITSILRQHYGSIVVDAKKFEKFNLLHKKYKHINDAESTAEEYYTYFSMNFSKSKSVSREVIQDAIDKVNEINIKYPDIDSKAFLTYKFNLESLVYNMNNDYEKMIEVCERAIQHFESQKIVFKNNIFAFKFKLLSGYIELSKYEAAKKVLNDCLELVSEGTYNWFITQEFRMLLFLSTTEYQSAWEVFEQVRNHNRFDSLFSSNTERWNIYIAYLSFLISIDKISPTSSFRFRLAKFLNEVPTYSKDKQGFNIAILIIQILHKIQAKQYNDVIERVRALELYRHKYLRSDETLRSNCFINFLVQFLKNDFDNRRTSIFAEKYWKKLQETRYNPTKETSIEVIPYEVLWQLTLEMTQRNRRRA